MITLNNKDSGNHSNFAKLRVVHVLYSGLGGHSAVLFALLEGGFLCNAQHSIVFAGVELPPTEYILRCGRLQVDWYYVSKDAGKGHLKFMFNLSRQLSVMKPDILFLHGLAAMPAVAVLKLLLFGRKPFVLVRETQANHLKTRREWILLALAHRLADRIVHLTDEAAQGAAQRLGRFIRPGKVNVVPNGLDTDFYRPRDIVKSDNAVINIGMQSRLQPNKDHLTLVKAFKLICERHSDKRFHLHIAGDGTTYHSIQKLVRQNNMEEYVTLHGMLGQAGLRDFLQGLDIYVHSTHGETMSTAIMQALSCGLPVIASDVPGVSNMVRAESGILYQPGVARDLAEKLDDLVSNPLRAQEWGLKARNYALRHYSIVNTINTYQILLQCG